MEKETRKRALYAAFAIIFILGSGLAMYKIVKWDEKNAIERQKLEEQKEKEEKEKAEEKILKYVNKCTEKLQNKMQKEGIEDLQVRYTRCSEKEYKKHWDIDGYKYEDEDVDYFLFYKVDYYSDSIDSIYSEKVQNGDFKPFVMLMDHTAFAGDVDEISFGKRHEVEWGDKTIAVYIASENSLQDITIRKEPDQTYRYEEYGDDVRIYVNKEKVYEGEKLTYDGSPYSSQSSGSADDKSNHNSWKSGAGYTTPNRKNDAYDVYDYDDPDEFADDWGEEFGNGNYEEGYDEAYDYWEENRD